MTKPGRTLGSKEIDRATVVPPHEFFVGGSAGLGDEADGSEVKGCGFRRYLGQGRRCPACARPSVRRRTCTGHCRWPRTTKASVVGRGLRLHSAVPTPESSRWVASRLPNMSVESPEKNCTSSPSRPRAMAVLNTAPPGIGRKALPPSGKWRGSISMRASPQQMIIRRSPLFPRLSLPDDALRPLSLDSG